MRIGEEDKDRIWRMSLEYIVERFGGYKWVDNVLIGSAKTRFADAANLLVGRGARQRGPLPASLDPSWLCIRFGLALASGLRDFDLFFRHY